MMTHRTKEEAQTEAKRAPCIAIHLQGNLRDFDHNWKARNFVGLQKCTIQAPKYCSRINPIALAVFQSLPAGTNETTYAFMGQPLNTHIIAFEHAIHIEHNYHLISDVDYMNYEKKDAYPKTTSDESFLNFVHMIKLYKTDLSKTNNEFGKTINFLLEQAENEPLHEPTWGWNYSKTRRDAIARLLPALRTILEPKEA
jgi:hypothetical protein